MVRLLLNHGATANSEIGLGRTLLHQVASGQCGFGYNGVRITELLMEHGADVNAQDRGNTTPLHLASYFGSVEISRTLLNHGASANAKRKLGRTPLHLVAEGKHGNDVLITDLLLEHGADIHAQDKDNMTPLHLASYCGKVEISQVLLDCGANASAKNALGLTPLHMVSQGTYHSHDDVGVAQLLLEHGADVNAQDKNHATPLDLALCHHRTEIAALLLHYSDKAIAKIDQSPLAPPRQLRLEGMQFHDSNEHSSCPPKHI